MLSFNTNLFLSALTLILAFSGTFANHVQKGHVVSFSKVNIGKEEFPVTTEQDIEKPTVSWENIAAEGAQVKDCKPHQIVFGGTLDKSDFKVGVVLTFPKDEYYSFGCTLPPNPSELMRKDQIVFRKITSVTTLKNGCILVHTKFTNGAKVIPTVVVTIGAPASSVRVEQRDTGLQKSSNRFDAGSSTLDKRRGVLPLNQDIEIRFEIAGTVGLCEVRFDRRTLTLSFEFRFRVDLSAVIRVLRAASFTGQTAPVGPFPAAGFSLRIPGLGQVTVGFVWQVRGVGAFSAGFPFDSTLAWKSESGARVEARLLRGIRVIGLGENDEGITAGLEFDEGSLALGAQVNGFLGVRPEILATIDVPFFDDVSATLGFSGGILVDAKTRVPPFPPVTESGRKFGPCERPHILEGSLSTEGRDFSASVSIPVVDEVSVTIRQKFLTLRVGTVCALAPSPSPTPPQLPPASPTPPQLPPEPTPEEIIPCSQLQEAGNQGDFEYGVQLGATSGTVVVSYEFFRIPDALTIIYEGQTLLSTGQTSGRGTRTVSYSGSSTLLRVQVDAPNSGTAWEVTVSCPDE